LGHGPPIPALYSGKHKKGDERAGHLNDMRAARVDIGPYSRGLDWRKEYNNEVNRLRYVIEQVIANFKTWRIMHTDYWRPIGTFPETIYAVIGLHFYRLAE
jgi:hypothetical protein